MIILCEYCDLRYICYDDWMEHLLSIGHQNVIGKVINSWEPSLNERSLVVTLNGNGSKPEKADICWYFANYGLVADAFFESDLEFCVIQLDKKDYATNALSTKHSMESTDLTLRRKADISDAEWLVLNTMGRRNSGDDLAKRSKESFEDRHSKLTMTLRALPINCQVEQFERETRMTSSEFALRQKLLKDISKLFTREFPKSVVHPYGSLVTGLGSKESVLHLYFDATGRYGDEGRTGELLPSTAQIMDKLETCIRNANAQHFFCHDFIVLPRDATPCIKFTHYLSGVNCKIIFKSLLPVVSSKLIYLVMKLDDRLPPLFLLLRYWGKYHKLTGPQLITGYSLNLLLLVFLTMKKIIPSVAALKSMGNKSRVVEGWETGFCTDKDKIVNVMSFLGLSSSYEKNPATGKPTAKSVLQLAGEFFKLFAHSDLQSQVVCPAIGEFMSKDIFERRKDADLPKGLEPYRSRIHVVGRLDTKSMLCIQDPFDLVCNVSSETQQDVILKFQFTCADTLENIETILNSPNLHLLDIFGRNLTNIPKRASASSSATWDNSDTSSRSYDINPSGSSKLPVENILRDPRLRLPKCNSPSSSSSSQNNSHQSRQVYDYENSSSEKTVFVYPETDEPEQQYPYEKTNYSMQQNQPLASSPSEFYHQSQQSQSKYSYNSDTALNFIPNEMYTAPQHSNQYESQFLMEPSAMPQYSQEYSQGNMPQQVYQQQYGAERIVQLPTSASKTRAISPIIPPRAAAPKRSRNRKKLPNISYSKIVFGNFEQVLVYPPDRAFEKLFTENFGNLVSEENLKIRLRVLWCIFMNDFFYEVWRKCFSFAVVELNFYNIPMHQSKDAYKVVVDYIRRRQRAREANMEDLPPEPKKPKVKIEAEIDEEPETEQEQPIVFLYAPEENPCKQKFFEIQTQFSHNNAFNCTVQNTFIVGRSQIRKNCLINDPASMVEKFPNPLDWEAEITRRSRFAKSSVGRTFDFIVKISIDSSNVENVTVVIKDIQGTSRDVVTLIPHLKGVFHTLVPNYSNYRLKKWLDTTES